MADMCDTCNDGVVDLLKKLLAESRDSFIRLGQINASVAAGGGGGAGGDVNLTGINGVAPSVNNGTTDAGTLRVTIASDSSGASSDGQTVNNTVTFRANYTTAQTDTAIVTVAGGSRMVVKRLTVTSDNGNIVDVAVRIGFGAATTPTATGVLLSHPGIAPGSGNREGDGDGILGVGALGEDLRITSEVPSNGSIDVVVTYFLI